MPEFISPGVLRSTLKQRSRSSYSLDNKIYYVFVRTEDGMLHVFSEFSLQTAGDIYAIYAEANPFVCLVRCQVGREIAHDIFNIIARRTPTVQANDEVDPAALLTEFMLSHK